MDRIEEKTASRLVSLSSHNQAASITFLRDSASSLTPFHPPQRPTGRMPSTLSFVPVAVPVLGWLLATILVLVVHFLACWRRRAHLVGHLPKVSEHESESGGEAVEGKRQGIGGNMEATYRRARLEARARAWWWQAQAAIQPQAGFDT